MKLRNKKTGMIGEAGYISTTDGTIIVNNINDQDEWYDYNSLAELNADWEDVPEEPKEYWFIDEYGMVQQEIDYYYDENKSAVHDKRLEVGNYFGTREEAKQAVEKLKAWQRLEDKGFKFDGIDFSRRTIKFKVPSSFFDGEENIFVSEQSNTDLRFLFGGEE